MQTETAGRLLISVLEQSTYWRDVDGNVRALTEMDRSHLSNLIPFLTKHGERLRFKWLGMMSQRHHVRVPTVIAEVDGRSIESWGPGGAGFPLFSDNGGNLDAAFYGWMDREQDRPFDDWLNDRPLVKAIREELERRSPEPDPFPESAPF